MKADLQTLDLNCDVAFLVIVADTKSSLVSHSQLIVGVEKIRKKSTSNWPQCPHILGHLALTVSYIIPPNTFLSVHQLFGQPGLAPQLRSLSTHASVHEQWNFDCSIQTSAMSCDASCVEVSRGCSVQLLTWSWWNSIGDLALMLIVEGHWCDITMWNYFSTVGLRFRNKTRRLSVWRRSIRI